MKTFKKSLIAASIAIVTTAFAEGNHIAQVDEHGHIKKDFALVQEAGQVKTVTSASMKTFSGQDAIDELGSEITTLAEQQGVEVEYIKHQFLTDPTDKLAADNAI